MNALGTALQSKSIIFVSTLYMCAMFFPPGLVSVKLFVFCVVDKLSLRSICLCVCVCARAFVCVCGSLGRGL